MAVGGTPTVGSLGRWESSAYLTYIKTSWPTLVQLHLLLWHHATNLCSMGLVYMCCVCVYVYSVLGSVSLNCRQSLFVAPSYLTLRCLSEVCQLRRQTSGQWGVALPSSRPSSQGFKGEESLTVRDHELSPMRSRATLLSRQTRVMMGYMCIDTVQLRVVRQGALLSMGIVQLRVVRRYG